MENASRLIFDGKNWQLHHHYVSQTQISIKKANIRNYIKDL